MVPLCIVLIHFGCKTTKNIYNLSDTFQAVECFEGELKLELYVTF